LRGNINY